MSEPVSTLNGDNELREQSKKILQSFVFHTEQNRSNYDNGMPDIYGTVIDQHIDKIITLLHQRDEAIKLKVVEHIMSTKTEGLFDMGDLFIKRAPIEQAAIDLIGYEAFKAIQESLPPTNPEKGNSNG